MAFISCSKGPPTRCIKSHPFAVAGFAQAGCRPKLEDSTLSTLLKMLFEGAQRDFAKRFERDKLSFTGDALQVISVSGRQLKFGKLLKRLTVGA
jgi:hypothetical protein